MLRWNSNHPRPLPSGTRAQRHGVQADTLEGLQPVLILDGRSAMALNSALEFPEMDSVAKRHSLSLFVCCCFEMLLSLRAHING